MNTYLAPDSRRPTLARTSQTPLGGQPAGIEHCDARPAASTGIPKLLLVIFEGSPALLITRETADWCAADIAALASASCGQAGHHAPEDHPEETAAWADAPCSAPSAGTDGSRCSRT